MFPTFAITYWDQKSGWQVSSAFAYAINFENSATDYTSGNIFHNDSCITKMFGALQVGAVGYAMVQTTPDSGRGATLGANESQVYGVGPIVAYTLGAGKPKPLTLVVKWYHEFDAKRTRDHCDRRRPANRVTRRRSWRPSCGEKNQNAQCVRGRDSHLRAL